MKLLLIIAIDEYSKNIKNILRKAKVRSFTAQPVSGFYNNPENELSNWFAADDIAVDAALFTVLVSPKCEADIYQEILNFNANLEVKSRVHLAVINLEKSI